ncbi:transcriptional regulator with XRE-family HTH domain [Haloferula luteola]|uniref:Transcriptional regulator with XRE-family HTH domain n=1 Tax=Haloferula luteola TaxID=595692 RepID=A0A840UY53_9BACT|nr:helix-turn-helix transcriptional regulator [Haloferula luteola]MBB5351077.1 transcriptional regulator with XRE-family HTH domain [Haloferula luteola]
MLTHLNDAEIGAALREWRKRSKTTAQALAQSAKISQGYLSDIENGRRRLTRGTLEKIAASEGVSLDRMITLLEAIAGNGLRIQKPKEDRSQRIGRRSSGSPLEEVATDLIAAMKPDEIARLLAVLAEEGARGDGRAFDKAQAILSVMRSHS